MDVGAGSLSQVNVPEKVQPAKQNRLVLFFRRQLDSFSASKATRMAEKSISRGELQQAIDFYCKAIALESSSELYYLRGLLKHKMKKYKEAISDFDEAINAGKDDCDVHYAKARAHVFLHNYETALTEELRAHKNGKNGKVTSLAIAKLYEICGNECLRRGNGSAATAEEYFIEAKKWRDNADKNGGGNGE